MLLSKGFVATFGERFNEIARRAGVVPDLVYLPADAQARLSQSDCDRIEVTYLARDIRFSAHYKS